MPVLSQSELDFFDEHGYVVARQVIDRDQAERTAAAIWEFSGKDPDDPETWYGDASGIMVEIYHHQTIAGTPRPHSRAEKNGLRQEEYGICLQTSS